MAHLRLQLLESVDDVDTIGNGRGLVTDHDEVLPIRSDVVTSDIRLVGTRYGPSTIE